MKRSHKINSPYIKNFIENQRLHRHIISFSVVSCSVLKYFILKNNIICIFKNSWLEKTVGDRWSWNLYLMNPTHLKNEDQSLWRRCPYKCLCAFVSIYLCFLFRPTTLFLLYCLMRLAHFLFCFCLFLWYTLIIFVIS